MRRGGEGMLVKRMVLFDGGVLEDEICGEGRSGSGPRQRGKIDAAPADSPGESRFSSLNHMGICLKNGDMDGLKREMRNYLSKTGTVETMFDLM